MANYPTTPYNPRTKQNKVGVVYDPDIPTTLFAQDISLLDDEVVAVETDLIAKINQAVKTDSSPEFAEVIVGTDITQLLGEITLVIDAGGTDIDFIIPSITPEFNYVFNQSVEVVHGTLGILSIDEEEHTLSVAKYNSILKTFLRVDITLETDWSTYLFTKISGEVQLGNELNGEGAEAILKTETVVFPDTGSGAYGVKFLTGFDTLGTNGMGIDGQLMLKGYSPGSDALLGFVNSDLELEGFLGYLGSLDTFIIFGGSNGPYVGPLVYTGECDILTLNMSAFLHINETGDIGHIPFRIGKPGFGYPAAINAASIDLVCVYVGSSYPTDVAVSTALDFSTMPLSGTLTHVMRLSELQRVGIGNQDPQHKLHVTGDLEIENLNTSIISDELAIDLSAIYPDLVLTLPILEDNALSSLPGVLAFPYALGVYDRFAIIDKTEQGFVELMFSDEIFSTSATIHVNFTDARFEFNWPVCPAEDDNYDLGILSKQWHDLYLSGKITVGGTSAVVDGTYTVGIGGTQNGTITVKGGIITAVQEAI